MLLKRPPVTAGAVISLALGIGSTTAMFSLLGACGSRRSDPISGFVKDKQAAVFVFLAADCPLSQAYSTTLNELTEEFRPRGIEFYGIFPIETGMKDFVAAYKLTFPVQPDHDFQLTDHFGASRTPETFVVDSTGRVLYKGAIDNRAPELGQQRAVITERYLRDALNGIARHESVRVKEVPAVGCFIERKAAG